MPADNIAYMWQAPSTNIHSVMISIFPYDGTSIGLAAGQTIEINVTSVAWRNNYLTEPPAMPTLATQTNMLVVGQGATKLLISSAALVACSYLF